MLISRTIRLSLCKELRGDRRLDSLMLVSNALYTGLEVLDLLGLDLIHAYHTLLQQTEELIEVEVN